MSRFVKATKEAIKLRGAIFGPSGAGKTMSCLRMMRGLVGPSGRIAFIDTETGSARRYADRFDFDHLDLSDVSIEGYVQAIEEARGYDGLIVDSLSQGWERLVEEVDRIAKAKYKGNTWSAWSEGTPMQRRLVGAIMKFNQTGHLLATMRSKTEWITVDDGRGKKAPQRVGLAPQSGKGIEYEFDFLLEMTTEHFGTVIKDRTGRFQDRIIEKPGEDFGKELAAWLADGVAAAPKPVSDDPTSEQLALFDEIKRHVEDAPAGKSFAAYKSRIRSLANEGRLTREQAERLALVINSRESEVEVAGGVA